MSPPSPSPLMDQTSSLAPEVSRWTCGAEAMPGDRASFDWIHVTCPACLAGRPGYRWLVSAEHLERPVWVRMVDGALEWWSTFDGDVGWVSVSEEEWGELCGPVLGRAEEAALRVEVAALTVQVAALQASLESASQLRGRVDILNILRGP